MLILVLLLGASLAVCEGRKLAQTPNTNTVSSAFNGFVPNPTFPISSWKLCSDRWPPGAPDDVSVVPGSVTRTSAYICWDPPGNYGCASFYEVSARPLLLTSSALGSSFLSSIKVQSSHCYQLTNLRPGTTYEVQVTSYSDSFGKGGSAKTIVQTL